jgi:hypothetical protein
MIDQSKDAFQAALRQDLRPFIEKSFQQITGGEKFQPKWYLDALAYKLMAVERGESRREGLAQPARGQAIR